MTGKKSEGCHDRLDPALILSLPIRLSPHLLDFGYLVDPATGLDCRIRGRDRQRVTRDFPADCLPLALPARLVEHVAALPDAIDCGADGQQAWLMLPAHRVGPDGIATPMVTVFQKLTLATEREPPGRPGDSIRSKALLFESQGFAPVAGELAAELSARMPVEAISMRTPPEARIGVERQPILVPRPAARTVGDTGPAARAMLAALLAGETLRLGAGDCATIAAFGAALADVLRTLPPGLRPHVSAAAGWSRPDEGVQLAWHADAAPRTAPIRDPLADFLPDMPLAEAGTRLFRLPGTAGPSVDHVDPAAGVGDLVMAHRASPGIARELRLHIAAHAVGVPGVAVPRGAAELVAALGERSTGAALRGVARALAEGDTTLVRTVSERLAAFGDRDGAAALSLLLADSVRPPTFAALALAAALASAAMDAGLAPWGERLHGRVARELRALAVSIPLLPVDDLDRVVSDPALASPLAEMLSAGDALLASRIGSAIDLALMVGGQGADVARRARRALLPGDDTAAVCGSSAEAAATDPLDLLLRLVGESLGGDADPLPMVWPLAERLAAAGRVDALVRIVDGTAARLGTLAADSGPTFSRALEVVGRLSALLLRMRPSGGHVGAIRQDSSAGRILVRPAVG
jgi:hypothetical protein